MRFTWKFHAPRPKTSRRQRALAFSWDGLEERKVLSHGGGVHHIQAAVAHVTSASSSNIVTGSTSTTSSSTLSTARRALQAEIQTILGASGTTVAELSTLHTAFKTLQADSLKPTSGSALASFENSLVTSHASGTTLTGNATLLAQFEALYTSTPTTQQTTDLAAAYDSLAAAVTSSNITSADIAAIDSAFSAVVTAAKNTSTATFPYFTLIRDGFGHFGGNGGTLGGPMAGNC